MMILAQASTPSMESAWRSVREGILLTFEHTTWSGWLILLAGILVGFVVGHLARKALESIADRMDRHGRPIRGTGFRSTASPASMLLTTLGISLGLGGVMMSDEVRWFVGRVLALAYTVGFGWLLFNLIDVIDLTLKRFASRTVSNLDDQMVPLVRKTLRTFLIIVLALFTLETVFNRDVSAWLAGLGIVGLAVSFAAQDSIKNFFGSITILLDRPFQLNDQIIVDSFRGNVEDIGFRSTRIRLLDGILVTIPNSKMVEQSVQNVTRRPYFRQVTDISITYDTAPGNIEKAVQIVRDLLAETTFAEKFDLVKFPPRAHFTEMKADTLNIQVLYWYKDPTDWWGFQAFNQRFNLEIVKRFAEAGIELAFPTRTLYLKTEQGSPLLLHRTANTEKEPGEDHA
jgi:MscS family membrane protein